MREVGRDYGQGAVSKRYRKEQDRLSIRSDESVSLNKLTKPHFATPRGRLPLDRGRILALLTARAGEKRRRCGPTAPCPDGRPQERPRPPAVNLLLRSWGASGLSRSLTTGGRARGPPRSSRRRRLVDRERLLVRPRLVPWSPAIAAWASVASGISTKPKPRGWPVSRSVINLTVSTVPYPSEQLAYRIFRCGEGEIGDKNSHGDLPFRKPTGRTNRDGTSSHTAMRQQAVGRGPFGNRGWGGEVLLRDDFD